MANFEKIGLRYGIDMAKFYIKMLIYTHKYKYTMKVTIDTYINRATLNF